MFESVIKGAQPQWSLTRWNFRVGRQKDKQRWHQFSNLVSGKPWSISAYGRTCSPLFSSTSHCDWHLLGTWDLQNKWTNEIIQFLKQLSVCRGKQYTFNYNFVTISAQLSGVRCPILNCQWFMLVFPLSNHCLHRRIMLCKFFVFFLFSEHTCAAFIA